MRTKVVFIGGGSFVFGPAMLNQAILENRLDGLEIVLVDPNREVVEPMAEIGRRMAEGAGVDARISSQGHYAEAMDGADFVLSCAAIQMNRRFAMDREILRETYPEHLVTEFGGVAGFASTLRQLALAGDIAAEMRKRCPEAWLFDVANPMPRVCQMASEEGVRTAGFCSVSVSGYGRLFDILFGEPDFYPFAESQARLKATMGGTNHLSWLVALHDRQTGEDLAPRLRQRLDERAATVRSKCEAWGRRTGYFLMSGDDHVQDFLPPEGLEHSVELTSHGSDEDRVRRLDFLHRVARGEADWGPLLENPSWERPFDVLRALRGGPAVTIGSLNLRNEGQIPQLPAGAFVETECAADAAGIHPERLDLPASVVPYARQAAEINGLLVAAAREKSRAKLQEAAEMDPTILDKARGWTALERCLEAHQDVIGTYR